MDTKIDLSGLLPNFSSLLGGIPETTQQLSDIFVWSLLGVFMYFLAKAYFSRSRSLERIQWLSKLVKDQTLENIAHSRDYFIQQAEDIKTKGGHLEDSGHLWLEFDETLVEVTNADGSPDSLRNTFDSHHFFNNSTLAAGITESRMLAAVPGFLTAVGVIGTFIGLQIGLSGLHLGNDVPISEMKTGLGVVISGAKTAFMTSVWGVFLSVVFNFTEKYFEEKVRKEIYSLQTRIDYLFPRLSAECQLQRIANDGSQSRESLQGLAEKIGDKMQESLIEVTSSIQSGFENSLKSVMNPAMEKLIAETSQGNEKALEGLLENFMSKFGEMGLAQREAMNMASDNVNHALGSLDTSMTAFLQKMETQQSSSAQREQELMTTIASQVNQLVTHSHEHNKMLSEAVNQHLGGLSKTFQNHENTSNEQNQLMVESMKFAQENSVQREQAMMETISRQVNKLVEHSHEQRQLLTETVSQQLISLKETFQDHQQSSSSQDKERQEAFTQQNQLMVDDMKATQEGSVRREQAMMETISSQVNKLVKHSHEQRQLLTEAVGHQLNSLKETFQDHQQTSSSQDKERQETFIQQNQVMVDSMKVAQKMSLQREQEMMTTISNKVNQLVEHSHEQRQLLNEAVGQQLHSLKETFQDHQQTSLNQDKERQQAFLQQADAVKSNIDSMLHRVENGLETQMSASKAILEQGTNLQNSLDLSVKANADASMGLRESAKELNSASREIKVFGTHIQDAGSKLSTAVSNAVESTSQLADQNQKASQMMVEQRQNLVNDQEQFMKAAEQLESLIHSADTSFDKMRDHQDEFLQNLKGNVGELSDQMTELLSGYADQANAHTASHLQEWAKGTTNYAEKMNQAANSLSSVVDEIEVKMQGRG